jgi:TrmH family RNA methyltransferase
MITSLQNPIIKFVRILQQKARERNASGLFVAEGRREVSLALAAGVGLEHILLCPDIYLADREYPLHLPAGAAPLELTRQVYNKLAYRQDAEGVILVGRAPALKLNDITLSAKPLLLILEAIEKPGNLGAIMRTADAAGVDAVILADPVTDIYNPNVIRSSLGCIFTLPVLACDTQAAISWLIKMKIQVVAAALQTDCSYYDADMNSPVAIAFGAEDAGLTQPWREVADKLVRIPMAGRIDSLNVAASVAVLLFEAVRQRTI